jgi:hypothetical protein
VSSRDFIPNSRIGSLQLVLLYHDENNSSNWLAVGLARRKPVVEQWFEWISTHVRT